MPRGSYIWVVMDWNAVDDELYLVYAATVKYELASWLKKQADPLRYDVFRIPDGVNNWNSVLGTNVDVAKLIKEEDVG